MPGGSALPYKSGREGERARRRPPQCSAPGGCNPGEAGAPTGRPMEPAVRRQGCSSGGKAAQPSDRSQLPPTWPSVNGECWAHLRPGRADRWARSTVQAVPLDRLSGTRPAHFPVGCKQRPQSPPLPPCPQWTWGRRAAHQGLAGTLEAVRSRGGGTAGSHPRGSSRGCGAGEPPEPAMTNARGIGHRDQRGSWPLFSAPWREMGNQEGRP